MLAVNDKDGVVQGAIVNQHADAYLDDWLQQDPATVGFWGHPRCGDKSVSMDCENCR